MKLFRRIDPKNVQISDRDIFEDAEDLFEPIIDAEAVQAEKANAEITRRRCAMLHRSEIIVAS